MVGVGVRAESCCRQGDPGGAGAVCTETGSVSISGLGLRGREMGHPT